MKTRNKPTLHVINVRFFSFFLRIKMSKKNCKIKKLKKLNTNEKKKTTIK